jgi:hypothetical protein
VKKTVEALNALSIFGPHHGGAYREHAAFVREVLGADVPTKIGGFISDWAADAAPGVVVLTGNAGTGKTALAELYCRTIGADLPADDGLIEVAGDRFVVKDLSGVQRAEDRREAVRLADEIRDGGRDATFLLCANEGLLRAAIAAAGLSSMIEFLDRGLANGAAREGRALLVNMNRQRWTGPTIWGRLLDYLTREDLWQPCENCAGAEWCPIAANAASLRAPGVRESARWLAQLAAGGGVATLRELLAVLAHAITGGLTCDEVQRRHDARGDEAFFADSGYFNLFFGEGLSAVRAERSPLLQGLRESGVGSAADLEVDSWLRDTGDAPRELRDLAGGDGAPVHARLQTPVGPMSFEKLGETISLSDDRTTVDACLENLARGGNFLPLWRRRVFFEAAPYVRGRTGAFTRLSNFSYFDDLLDLAESLREGRHAAEERQRIVTGLNYLAAGFHSFAGHLIVPDAASLVARNPGSFRRPAPSLVHSEVPVDRVSLRPEDDEELRAILDADDVRVVLVVDRGSGEAAELVLTPRLYQAVRESGEFRAPVGGDIPEMVELESFYASLATESASEVIRIVDPGREAIRVVTLPEFRHA